MKRYRLARPAKADLDLIWQRIAGESGIENASRLIDTITDRFPRLAEMPELGTTRDHIEGGVRAFPVGNYLIYYRRAQRGGILISRVIHGMRDQHQAWETRCEDVRMIRCRLRSGLPRDFSASMR